ncbi:MAG: ParA family protein [Candidatus Hydrothermarchaeota archaeon]
MASYLIASSKGGSGKSTFACEFAYYCSNILKKRTVLVDADIKASCIRMLLGEVFDPSRTLTHLLREDLKNIEDILYTSKYANLSLIMPSERADLKFFSKNKKMIDLLYCLKDIYDVVITDAPPDLEQVYRLSIPVDSLIGIIRPDLQSILHAPQLASIPITLKQVYRSEYTVSTVFEGFVVSMYDSSIKEQNEILKLLEDRGYSFLGKISFDKNVQKAQLKSKTLLEMRRKSKAAKELERIFIDLLKIRPERKKTIKKLFRREKIDRKS